MATERQLRRQMKNLQKEINDLNRSRDSFQREATRKNEEKIRQFRQQYDQALKRQKQETDELYSRRLRDYQNQMLQETRKTFDRMEAEARRIQQEQRKKLEELNRCNQELQAMLKDMNQKADQEAWNQRSVAEDLLREAQESRDRTENRPHEFFFRGEFDIIDGHAQQIASEIQQELYQAAAADASGVTMEFDLLRTRVDQALQEWMEVFAYYCSLVRNLAAQLKQLRETPLRTSAGSFKMKDRELNFWSSGTFKPMAQQIDTAEQAITAIESQGVEAYLKSGPPEGRKEIFRTVAEVQRWGDQLTAIANCILSERLLSDERFMAAEQITKVLEESGYTVLQSGFRSPDPSLQQEEWYPRGRAAREQNPMDTWEMQATIQGVDILHILLIPVREHGLAIRNECVVSLEAHTLQDAANSDSVVETNVRRIQGELPQVRVQGLASGREREERLDAVEKQRKRLPDPAAQARLLERKYRT